jgi:GMP synthase-like glutamine amidotransferase
MPAPGVVLQHGENGPPGHLAAFLDERGEPYVVHRVWEAPVPDLTQAAWVASLGSEHSATAQDPAWIPAEVRALGDAVEAEVPVLGLCFGAQALALALGGTVRRTTAPEIGWLPVVSEDAGVPSGAWAQYHYEVLEVPPGAREVARTAAGPAAFRLGPHLGVQFHPEVLPDQIAIWLGLDTKLPAGFDRDGMLAGSRRHGAEAGARARRLFATWFDALRS